MTHLAVSGQKGPARGRPPAEKVVQTSTGATRGGRVPGQVSGEARETADLAAARGRPCPGSLAVAIVGELHRSWTPRHRRRAVSVASGPQAGPALTWVMTIRGGAPNRKPDGQLPGARRGFVVGRRVDSGIFLPRGKYRALRQSARFPRPLNWPRHPSCSADSVGSNQRESTMPSSNSSHTGTASSTWEMTSGGVSTMPMVKAATMT